MSCYRPLLGRFQGFNENGKREYKILPYAGTPADGLDINVPCGHCIGCRLDYSRQWADRMMIELDHSKTGVFVTLTYSPINVPVACVLDDGSELYTLDKRDVQLFMKRLRKYFEPKEIRFYLAGEYGESTHRPHYHAILFGLSLDDLQAVPNGANAFGQSWYSSKVLDNIWKLGFTSCAAVSWQTCAYVSRYVTKKLSGDVSRETYDAFNVLPEFALMSRRPGIAGYFAEEHSELLKESKQYFLDVDGLEPRTSCRTPKYLFSKLELTNPDLYATIKEQRQIYARDKQLIALSRTDLDFCEYNKVCEENKKCATRALSREKI